MCRGHGYQRRTRVLVTSQRGKTVHDPYSDKLFFAKGKTIRRTSSGKQWYKVSTATYHVITLLKATYFTAPPDVSVQRLDGDSYSRPITTFPPIAWPRLCATQYYKSKRLAMHFSESKYCHPHHRYEVYYICSSIRHQPSIRRSKPIETQPNPRNAFVRLVEQSCNKQLHPVQRTQRARWCVARLTAHGLRLTSPINPSSSSTRVPSCPGRFRRPSRAGKSRSRSRD